MSFFNSLTDLQITPFMDMNRCQRSKSVQKKSLKLELEDNYYENLFLEEMEFKSNPKKEKIPKLIRKYCKAVEYFSSIEDNKKSKQYKTLIDFFLNEPTVLNLLDGMDNINADITSNSFMKKYIVSNKYKNLDNFSSKEIGRAHV